MKGRGVSALQNNVAKNMSEKVLASECKENGQIDIITQREFKKFGIDESYIPYGAVVSKQNPYCVLKNIYPNLDFLLQNKYGRDPWGGGTEFGVAKDIGESEYNIFINIDNPKISPKEKNEVLRKILLKTVSQDNQIYYIIPGYLAADLIPEIRYEKKILVEIIKKYFSRREKSIQIGTLEEQNSLLLQSLKHFFPQIKFVTLNLQENLHLEDRMDILYFTDASFNNLFRDTFGTRVLKLEQEDIEYLLRHLFYLIYNFLKPEGKVAAVSMSSETSTDRIGNLYTCVKELGFWQLAQPFFNKIEIPVDSNILIEDFKQRYRDFQIFLGQRKEGRLSVSAIAKRLYDLDLPGVPLSLVSVYKNSFSYLIEVLMIMRDLIDTRDRGHLKGLTEIQRDELETICTYQRERRERFLQSVVSLIEKIETLKEIERIVNPGRYQRARTQLLSNLDILPLFNFEKEEIEEMILIITGHSTMSGIVSGKLPGTALKPITGKVLLMKKELSQRQLSLLLDVVDSKILSDNKRPVSEEAKKFLEKILLKRKISNEKEMIYFKKIINEYRFSLGNYFLSPRQVFELVKRDYLKSIAEFAAGGGGLIPAKKVDRFTKLWREASELIYNPNVTWESIMEEKITNMGGTFWMSLRRLLRIFEILRVDPILMKELEHKTDFEIEAIAGHDKEMMMEYQKIRELIKIAKEFRNKYYGEINFDRPFFYRTLFEKFEIHGTGSIFPFLSTQSGFKLLWIACHVAKNNFIDFNPMITDENTREWKRKIKAIEDNLNLITIDDLNFSYLDNLKARLLNKEDIIIFDTGLELKLNENTECLEFTYSNVFKTIEALNGLIDSFRKNEININNIKSLKRFENCCSTIQKYPLAYRDEINRLRSFENRHQKVKELGKNIKVFETMLVKLQNVFIKDIFNPREFGTNISLMYQYSPKILEIVLNQFMEFENIKRIRKEHLESVNEYIIKIAKKFQAVATKTKSEFQDKTIFNRIAQEDFGEKTPVSIEVSEKQLDYLEGLYERVSVHPELVNATMVSILFFNIGKVPSLFGKYHKVIDFVTYNQAGEEILRREKILENIVHKETEELVLFLIRHIGKIGQIIKGESPLDELEDIIYPQGNGSLGKMVKKIGLENIWTAQAILSILITASAFEGLLTYDLIEKFFNLYQKGLSVIKKEKTISLLLKEKIYDNGRKAFQSIYPEETGESKRKEIERLGQEAIILEKLFSLRGIYNIFYHTVLEFDRKFRNELSFDKNGIPCFNKQMIAFVKFLLYKVSYHSVGIESFTKQMGNALGIYYEFGKLPKEIRRYFLKVFVADRDKARFWLLERSTKELTPKNQLKIILLGLKALDYRNIIMPRKKSMYISFFSLSKDIDYHYDLINKVMDGFSYTEIMDNALLKNILEKKDSKGIRFKYGSVNGAVKVSFQGILNIKDIIAKMGKIKSGRMLERFFVKEIARMKESEYNTEDYQKQLTDAFLFRREEVKNEIVEGWQKNMMKITLPSRVKHDILLEANRLLKKLEVIFRKYTLKGADFNISSHHFVLLRDVYEVTREKIRLATLKNLVFQQNNISDAKALSEFTQKCVFFIDKNVKLFGKEISWILLDNYKHLRAKL